ncbi:hypothetical protein [Corynebacterium timonense]|uniref:Secreted protein n=1 Tax=Corynebacterium timonense TaxID=441500 RepID=A0A1H1U7J4_9CORY|nr:hypothetical protein [Corynebacterium timonense]SDS68414.1 hypothetical protein SAMN04488539_2167 [Corynebacterium timonense]
MKIQKALLAIATASTIAVSGAAVANAQEDESGNPALTSETAGTETGTGTETGAETGADTDNGAGSGSSEKPGEKKSSSAGSSDKFFGWDESTTGTKKFEDIFGIIVKIFSGIFKAVKVFLPLSS